MKTTMRVALLALPLLALSMGCARDPDVGKFVCTSGAHCPDGYVCTGSPAAPGKCIRPADGAPPADGSNIPVDVFTPVDGKPAVDTPPVDGVGRDGADVPLGGAGGSVDGGGGTTIVPGTGGAGGAGGIVTVTGGSGGGGIDAAGGSGGTLDGGRDSGTGGVGTGGTTTTATGGIVNPGTGGTITGTGGTGTGGSGTGGNGTGGTITGTGGSGTGGSGTGGSGTGGITPAATVQLDQTHQTIEGFGLGDIWTAALTDAQADALFTTSSGIGLSILRVAMGSNGAFLGSNMTGDIAKVKTRGISKIIATALSAPATCKDNNNTQKGGHLLTSCYDSWSTTMTNFAKTNGIYAMSAANEPDFASCGSSIGPPCNGDYDTMVFTAKEMVSFVKVLGPKLQTAGVKLIAPEPAEWIHLWSNTSATGSTVASHPNSSDPLHCGCFGNTPTTDCATTCLNGNGYDYGHWLASDATAWAAVDILGTHEYDTQKAEPWPSDVNGGQPNKQVWVTEMSGIKYWPDGEPAAEIVNGVTVAGWIHSALVVGEASAWLWFGYDVGASADNEGLVLPGTTDTKRHYTLGNFSKFVRPGYTRVDVTGNASADVLLSAYKGADGTVVVVAINKGAAASVPIGIAGGAAPASCVPYLTSSIDNLAAKTGVPVSGGVFTAALAGTSVTSFVCK
jgi:glucuronoarabinoxylan endo-1,4-beta-xylanase